MTAVRIVDLAPACPKRSPPGRHCGHHGCLIFDGYVRLTCCYCNDVVEIPYIERKVQVAGHGPFITEEIDATDYENLPDGWELSEGSIS